MIYSKFILETEKKEARPFLQMFFFSIISLLQLPYLPLGLVPHIILQMNKMYH